MFEYRCQVLRVLDGDTVEAQIDLGFRLTLRTKIRLSGVSAPELKVAPQGQEAKAHLEGLLRQRTSVIVHTTLNHEFEKYGRVLGSIVADGVNVNRQMVLDGFAAATPA